MSCEKSERVILLCYSFLVYMSELENGYNCKMVLMVFVVPRVYDTNKYTRRTTSILLY